MERSSRCNGIFRGTGSENLEKRRATRWNPRSTRIAVVDRARMETRWQSTGIEESTRTSRRDGRSRARDATSSVHVRIATWMERTAVALFNKVHVYRSALLRCAATMRHERETVFLRVAFAMRAGSAQAASSYLIFEHACFTHSSRNIDLFGAMRYVPIHRKFVDRTISQREPAIFRAFSSFQLFSIIQTKKKSIIPCATII